MGKPSRLSCVMILPESQRDFRVMPTHTGLLLFICLCAPVTSCDGGKLLVRPLVTSVMGNIALCCCWHAGFYFISLFSFIFTLFEYNKNALVLLVIPQLNHVLPTRVIYILIMFITYFNHIPNRHVWPLLIWSAGIDLIVLEEEHEEVVEEPQLIGNGAPTMSSRRQVKTWAAYHILASVYSILIFVVDVLAFVGFYFLDV